MSTIRRQLLVWLLGGTLICSTMAGVALYSRVQDEANELFDAQLKQAADSSPTAISECIDRDPQGPEEEVIVQGWDHAGKLIYSCSSNPVLPRWGKNGYHGYQIVKIGSASWRVYTKPRTDAFIQVAQPMRVRDVLAAKIAMRSLFPFLIFIPILAMFIWAVVGRSLRPLVRLADAVAHRSANALQPLAVDGFSPEIRPVVDALNDLLKQLDEALIMQRAFVADAAHELRTPLAALKLQLQLAEGASTEWQRLAAFEKLHDRLDRAGRLVQQLLTLARHEGNRHHDVEEIDLHLLAQQAVADFYLLAERKNIDLGIDTCSTRQIIRGNPEGIRVIFSNLIDNAIRYTPADGKIDIGISLVHGCPALRVSDDGPGISADDRPRVFDRFFRGDEPTAWGSGLGLAIVKNIVDMHDASIHLKETSEKKGLTVLLIFRTGP